MALVALGLGSNLGNRLQNLRAAVKFLREAGLDVRHTSNVYETAPWGVTDQPYFLNACLTAECAYFPHELLATAKDTEAKIGRTTTRRWGERVIDIDILLMDSLVFDAPDLHIPHPYMHERGFVLIPLAEILPDWIHPATGRTVASMAEKYSGGVRICSL